MSRRPAIRCKGRRTDGTPCANFAMHGAKVCHAHGGRAPQTRAAAKRRLDIAKVERIIESIDLTGAAPLTDALGELSRVGGEVVALKNAIIARVAADPDVDPFLFGALERALDRATALLAGVVKLDIESRQARIETADREVVVAALLGTFADLGLNSDETRIRKAFAARLRSHNIVEVTAVAPT